ncbi:MAG: hypothetical protein ACPGJV_09140 [Bacteriovoracaceae bacterium]
MRAKAQNILVVLTVLLSFSCSVSKKKLTAEGGKVRILDFKKNTGCSVIDKVVGENDMDSEDLAKNHARNLAAKSGGNAIYFDEIIRNGSSIKIHSTAYQCN